MSDFGNTVTLQAAAALTSTTKFPLSIAGERSETLLSSLLSFYFPNTNDNLVFAGPSSGGAAAPAFRALVAADLPAQGANPSGTIGLTAVNGVATSYMRADGTPALSQAIVPTWTGLHTFGAGVTVSTGVFTGPAGSKTAPTFTFSGTQDGFYSRGSGIVALSVGGNAFIQFQTSGATQFVFAGGIMLGWTSQFSDATSSPVTTFYPLSSVAGVIQAGNATAANQGRLMDAGVTRLGAQVTNATNTMTSGPLTALSQPLINGQAYEFTLTLIMLNTTAAEGLSIDLGGGTATISSGQWGFLGAPANTGVTLGTLTASALGTLLTVPTATTADAVYVIGGTFVCSGSGTFIPRVAENSTHATGTATIEAASKLVSKISTN